MRKKPKPEVVGAPVTAGLELDAVLEQAANAMSALETSYIREWRRILTPLAMAAGYENTDVVADELAVVHRDDNSPASWKRP